MKGCGFLAAGVCLSSFIPNLVFAESLPEGLKEALWYEKLPNAKTRCTLCPNFCERAHGENGMCRSRGNRNGVYYSLSYGKPCVISLDEAEKCPLYHFQLSGKAFSIATAGCNLFCKFCQNWTFSQVSPEDAIKSYDLSPEAVVAKAKENNCTAISYFYTEPTVYYEYMLDTARLARRAGLKNIMVTAGYINPKPLCEILPHLDAVTMGIKGWNEKFYREYIGGELGHVKETIQELSRNKNVWWEAVNLVIPTLNDDMNDIAGMAKWLRDTAGAERPLHFSRFRPEYRLKLLPMTPYATLTRARDLARKEGLQYVYIGNMPGHEGANTWCPSCGKMVVERLAFTVLKKNIVNGCCAFCNHTIKGVWT